MIAKFSVSTRGLKGHMLVNCQIWIQGLAWRRKLLLNVARSKLVISFFQNTKTVTNFLVFGQNWCVYDEHSKLIMANSSNLGNIAVSFQNYEIFWQKYFIAVSCGIFNGHCYRISIITTGQL